MLLEHIASSDKWFRTRHYSDEMGGAYTVHWLRGSGTMQDTNAWCDNTDPCVCSSVCASEVMCVCVIARKWGNANDGDGQYDPWGKSLWCGVVVDAHCGGTVRSVTRITFKNRTCILLLQPCNNIWTSKIVVLWGFKNFYRVDGFYSIASANDTDKL